MLKVELGWLTCVFDPAKDSRQWYTQLMFAQHAAKLAPVWGRSLAPFADARRLVEQPAQVQALDVDALDEDMEAMAGVDDRPAPPLAGSRHHHR